MPPAGTLTEKGAATRSRIVEAAADLVLERGVGRTTLDDIRAGTQTSKGQLFHYFPGGKGELVGAMAMFQGERVLDAQRPYLDALDTWDAWEGWRRAVLHHYGSQPHWGCPIGALASELIGRDPQRSAEVAALMDRWRTYFVEGLKRMRATSLLVDEANLECLAFAIFAALQGGLLLTQTEQSLAPLEAALEGALTLLRGSACPTTLKLTR